MSLTCIPVYLCEWERGEATASGQEIITLYMLTVTQTMDSLPALRGPGLDPSREEPLEKGMATHTSILAWRIPWTEGPGGL